MRESVVTLPDGTEVVVRLHDPAPYWGAKAELKVQLSHGRTASITVAGPEYVYGGSLRPAQVNWSALGSVDAADALAYASGLAYASEIAATLAGPTEKA